jgi:septum formation protein
VTKKILLASASPRRRSLLGLLGVAYDVTKADIDETPLPGEPAAEYTRRLSREKAQAVLKQADSDCLIVASDTTVADGAAILGKPADPVEARAMLVQLRGRVHQVYTAITLLDTASGRIHSEVALTDVCMRAYTDAEIETYIASGDPFDKAGGYAIQNADFHPVEELRGCYSNVVGLPLCYLVQALRDFGITLDLQIALECQHHPGSDCVLNGVTI